MRVGLVVYGDIDTVSGGFHYDRKLVERLRERGDDVEIVSLPWRDSLRGLLDGRSESLLEDLDAGFDLLLEDELAHPTLLGVNRRLRARVDLPILAVVHHLRCSEAGPAWERRFHRALERRYLATLDGAVCNSAATRAAVDALADLPTTVAPPAGDRFDPDVTTDEIEGRAAGPGPLRLCFLGSLIPRKGLESLVEGLSRLPDDRWRLTVVGHETDPEYAARVRRRTDQLGLDGVRFAGGLPDDDLAGVLRESHVLAMPSTHEGFGIAYLEGMSFGLPVLASTAGGARDLVAHGETGFLLPPGDPAAIATAVRRLAGDRERLARMGVAARERYAAWPTWAETGDEVRRFLREFTDAPAAGRARRVEA